MAAEAGAPEAPSNIAIPPIVNPAAPAILMDLAIQDLKFPIVSSNSSVVELRLFRSVGVRWCEGHAYLQKAEGPKIATPPGPR